MTVRQVLRIGHPILRRKAEPVANFGNNQLDELITDMKDTMKVENGVGIAAPQIGVSLRVVIFGFDQNSRYPTENPIPFTVLVNPQITFLTNEVEDAWEGCLSVPKMRGLVPRHVEIKYSGYDHKGVFLEREVRGFHARVVQHECDHLDGILYPMRINDLSYFGYSDELEIESN